MVRVIGYTCLILTLKLSTFRIGYATKCLAENDVCGDDEPDCCFPLNCWNKQCHHCRLDNQECQFSYDCCNGGENHLCVNYICQSCVNTNQSCSGAGECCRGLSCVSDTGDPSAGCRCMDVPDLCTGDNTYRCCECCG